MAASDRAVSGNRFTRGLTIAAAGIWYIQQCLTPSLVTSEAGNQSNPDQRANRRSSWAGLVRSIDTITFSSPTSRRAPCQIIQKLRALRRVQKHLDASRQQYEETEEPSLQLGNRVNAAIENLQERMTYNTQYEGSLNTARALSQRIEDLSHCLDHINRQLDSYAERIQELELEENTCGQDLADAIEQWLTKSSNYVPDQMEVDTTSYQAPFDLTIVREAETAYEQQKLSDDEEKAFLDAFILQPEGGGLGRRELKRAAHWKIEEAVEAIRNNKELLRYLTDYRTSQDEGQDTSKFDIPERLQELHIDQAVRAVENDLEAWDSELQEMIRVGRELYIDVTSEGVILSAMEWDPTPSQAALWAGDEADTERDLTADEAAEHLKNIKAKVEPWQEATDFELAPEDVPATPTAPNEELTEPIPSDSATNFVGGMRVDFGYSIYRNELVEMERLRSEARAALPPDAPPAEKD